MAAAWSASAPCSPTRGPYWSSRNRRVSSPPVGGTQPVANDASGVAHGDRPHRPGGPGGAGGRRSRGAAPSPRGRGRGDARPPQAVMSVLMRAREIGGRPVVTLDTAEDVAEVKDVPVLVRLDLGRRLHPQQARLPRLADEGAPAVVAGLGARARRRDDREPGRARRRRRGHGGRGGVRRARRHRGDGDDRRRDAARHRGGRDREGRRRHRPRGGFRGPRAAGRTRPRRSHPAAPGERHAGRVGRDADGAGRRRGVRARRPVGFGSAVDEFRRRLGSGL